MKDYSHLSSVQAMDEILKKNRPSEWKLYTPLLIPDPNCKIDHYYRVVGNRVEYSIKYKQEVKNEETINTDVPASPLTKS